MSRARPQGTCVEIGLGGSHAVGAFGLVALEDYARAVTLAEGSEALPDAGEPARVIGVHLCAPAAPVADAARADIEAFARELAERAGEGLGWS